MDVLLNDISAHPRSYSWENLVPILCFAKKSAKPNGIFSKSGEMLSCCGANLALPMTKNDHISLVWEIVYSVDI